MPLVEEGKEPYLGLNILEKKQIKSVLKWVRAWAFHLLTVATADWVHQKNPHLAKPDIMK
ncbi:hypothetical protein IPJ72_02225 [Candidatus Peregrinibacteria bacterium]|nr:MAG: hypothetical protein IPJ72_02225 [Candidatus Peregrinibacteria bacterium]